MRTDNTFFAAIRLSRRGHLGLRLKQWWRGSGTYKQDLFVNLAPMMTALMFLLAIVLAFAYLENEEYDLLQEQLQRDKGFVSQRLSLRLDEIDSGIAKILLANKNNGVDSVPTEQETQVLFNLFPELLSLTWVDSEFKLEQYQSASTLGQSVVPEVGKAITDDKILDALSIATNIAYPVYSDPAMHTDRPDTFALVYPLVNYHSRVRGSAGALILEFDIDTLLNYLTPKELRERYAISSFVRDRDAQNYLRSGSTLPPPQLWFGLFARSHPSIELQWSLPELGNGLQLRLQAYRGNADLLGRNLFWVAFGLALFTMALLFINWRHMRRRNAAQDALQAEANFRRAMGNSMLVGVRVLDMQARITYINPAFCHMTDFSEVELLYTEPPFPFWPDKNIQDLSETLKAELQNVEHIEGHQVQLMRKNGDLFYARIYTSPLVDGKGEQSGWITSMTDITEPTRIRQQLSESFDRFTLVLEGLDASVSVVLAGGSELVFANRLYREWFGDSQELHQKLLDEVGLADTQTPIAGQQSPTKVISDTTSITDTGHSPSEVGNENAEIYIPILNKWFEVRSRQLKWVDGRLAQMVIASDITPRRQAEALELEQAQRTEKISHLIAMGEMASGVAHELNQPLTAISNYCTGMLQRLKRAQLDDASLQAALEKTERQAQRAGQIVQRIREFVKRSEPNRSQAQAKTLVNNTLELASIELRKRGVRLQYDIDVDLPALMVDSILIEQVLINLLKNAAESIEQAQKPIHRRIVHLCVRSLVVVEAEQSRQGIEFCVEDTGAGIAPDVMDRLYETFFSTKSDGMGMGLSLCRSIIESHQGRIHAKNLYNGPLVRGCQFSFWLPVISTKVKADDTSN